MGQQQEHYLYSAHCLYHSHKSSEALWFIYYNIFIFKKGPQPIKHKAQFLAYYEDKKQPLNKTQRTERKGFFLLHGLDNCKN